VHLGRAYYGLGNVEMEVGNIAAAEYCFSEARTAYLAGNAVRGVAYAYHGAGRVSVTRGAAKKACAQFREALRIIEAEEEIDPHNRALFLSSLALASRDLGETDAAEKQARTALALYRQLGHASGISRCLGLLGSILVTGGKINEGAIILEEALAAADNAEGGQYRGWALRYLSDVAILRGENDEARRLLTLCLTEARERREQALIQSAQETLSRIAAA
jgi:tetratricopeptide (TPR) repeat protein